MKRIFWLLALIPMFPLYALIWLMGEAEDRWPSFAAALASWGVTE